MRSFSALLGAAFIAATLVFAGCGGTVIDLTKAEEALKASLANSLEEKVSSVECPSKQKLEVGATFTCSVKLADGKTGTATLKIVDEDADVHVVNFTETSQQGQ